MTLGNYLKYRKRYEVLTVFVILLIFAGTNMTSDVIDNVREGYEADWLGAMSRELSSVLAVFILLPGLLAFVNWLNLSFSNLKWRILWHLPAFLVFSFLHIGLFVILRQLLWRIMGEQYSFGPLVLNTVYEIRKDLLAYLGIMVAIYSYQFILTRLQGEARFLSDADERIEPHLYKNQFLVKMLNREFLVRVEEIQWIRSASNYVLMKCGDRDFPMRQTLTALAEQLDPERFLRVHRTAIVNLDKVRALQESGEMLIELNSGEQVPVSKTYLPALKQALNARAGAR